MAAARKQAGLTQVTVAEEIGTDQTCVSRFELGKVPSLTAALDTIDRFCKAVGCDPIEIVAPFFTTSLATESNRRTLERAS